jgi:hypothetical protein
MTDIDRRIRRAYRPATILTDHWAALEPQLAERRLRPRRGRTGRIAIAIAILGATFTSIALAKEGSVRRLVGLDDSRPATQMHVFKQPADVSTKDTRFGDMLPAGGEIPGAGTLLKNDMHLALDFRSGDFRVRLLSAPTNTGKACLYSEMSNARGVYSGGLSCSYAIRYNGYATVGASYDIRNGLTVIGLVTDRVRQVRVHLPGGDLRDATMGDNAFAWHGSTRVRQARGIQLELRDGRRIEVAMNGCLRSQMVPPPKSRLGCGFGMNRGPVKPPT